MCQGDLQQRFDDVANSAVVRQSDFLCSADKISQAKSIEHDCNGLVYTKAVRFISTVQQSACLCTCYISTLVLLTFNQFKKATASKHY